MFNAVDTDRSGKITAKELQQALQNGKGQNFSDRCCQLLICEYDITYVTGVICRKLIIKSKNIFPI